LKKKLLLIAIVLCIFLFVAYKYIYADHRNISDEQATYSLLATELIEAYTTNAEDAETKFLDKVVEITGLASQINVKESNIALNEMIFAYVTSSNQLDDIQLNQLVKIKGRIIGYDEIMNEIKMDQCEILP
jgi:hypothetical protein